MPPSQVKCRKTEIVFNLSFSTVADPVFPVGHDENPFLAQPLTWVFFWANANAKTKELGPVGVRGHRPL